MAEGFILEIPEQVGIPTSTRRTPQAHAYPWPAGTRIISADKTEQDVPLDQVTVGALLRVRPGGPGWATISTRLGYGREAIPGGALAWTNWIAGVIAKNRFASP